MPDHRIFIGRGGHGRGIDDYQRQGIRFFVEQANFGWVCEDNPAMSSLLDRFPDQSVARLPSFFIIFVFPLCCPLNNGRWCHSVFASPRWRPSRSISLAIAPMTAMGRCRPQARPQDLDRAAPLHSQIQDPERSVLPSLSTPLAGRAVLCLAAIEPALAPPSGVVLGLVQLASLPSS